MDAPLSSADVKFLLIQRREAKFSTTSFFTRLQYIVNQSRSAKETVNLKIDQNIEMLACFICMVMQYKTLIDINHHYQIMMNQHKN